MSVKELTHWLTVDFSFGPFSSFFDFAFRYWLRWAEATATHERMHVSRVVTRLVLAEQAGWHTKNHEMVKSMRLTKASLQEFNSCPFILVFRSSQRWANHIIYSSYYIINNVSELGKHTHRHTQRRIENSIIYRRAVSLERKSKRMRERQRKQKIVWKRKRMLKLELFCSTILQTNRELHKLYNSIRPKKTNYVRLAGKFPERCKIKCKSACRLWGYFFLCSFFLLIFAFVLEVEWEHGAFTDRSPDAI